YLCNRNRPTGLAGDGAPESPHVNSASFLSHQRIPAARPTFATRQRAWRPPGASSARSFSGSAFQSSARCRQRLVKTLLIGGHVVYLLGSVRVNFMDLFPALLVKKVATSLPSTTTLKLVDGVRFSTSTSISCLRLA